MRKALPSWSHRGTKPFGSSSSSKIRAPSWADAPSRKIHSRGRPVRRCASRHRARCLCDDVPRQRYRADAVPGRMPRSLEGHVAVVTGSTGEGMGRSTALTLAREGAAVVLNHGTNRTTGATNNRRLGDVIRDFGARSIVVRANTTKAPEVRRMFARDGLTRILSEGEIGRGITINAIAPGYIPAFTFRQAVEAVRHGGPWGGRTHGTPQDVAEVASFLCSDQARNVTGAVIPVHGAPDD